uniref:Uncharacterized protein n=1 Tax=Anguilla anguilla TaxID=7936 RepID=A0A0E9PZP0_ANGAN
MYSSSRLSSVLVLLFSDTCKHFIKHPVKNTSTGKSTQDAGHESPITAGRHSC